MGPASIGPSGGSALVAQPNHHVYAFLHRTVRQHGHVFEYDAVGRNIGQLTRVTVEEVVMRVCGGVVKGSCRIYVHFSDQTLLHEHVQSVVHRSLGYSKALSTHFYQDLLGREVLRPSQED